MGGLSKLTEMAQIKAEIWPFLAWYQEQTGGM
jgi:hypothetical protein